MTPKLNLPYLAVGQAQKETTHNEALNLLDALVQGSVIDSFTTAPPGGETDGDAWIVATGATGDWAGHDGEIALWFGGWTFLAPVAGWQVWDADLGRQLHFDGTAWQPATQVPTLGNSWAGFSGGYANPRYRKAADGMVTIEGMMQSGSDGVVFTLLAGFRPAERLVFCCWSGGGPYRVDVHANGDVEVQGSNAVFSSLAGIQFLAEG